MKRLRRFITAPARLPWRKFFALAGRLPFRPGSVATLALVAISVGLWWERPSLALIIPGAIVFGCLTWTHLRGNNA
jgi:hypothetical protein